MSEAQLRGEVDAYQREEAWAPKYVGDHLAQAWHAANTAKQDAVLQQRYADTSTDPAPSGRVARRRRPRPHRSP